MPKSLHGTHFATAPRHVKRPKFGVQARIRFIDVWRPEPDTIVGMAVGPAVIDERPRTRAFTGPGALCGLIVVAFVALCFQLLDSCLDDDAYISFRYARNLLEGHGLVYNVGERVEGYTNFLWTVLCAGAMGVGLPVHATAQLMGIVLSALTLWLMHRLARRAEVSPVFALAGLAALTATLPFAVETLLGLEIPLYVFLSLAALSLWCAPIEQHSRARSMLCGAVFALTAMTRPEGMALFALSFVPDLRIAKGWLRALPIAAWSFRALGFALIFAPYFAWRFSYYGYPLPNTFYAKTGGGAWLYQLGAEYVGSALLRCGPIVLLAIAPFLVARSRNALPRHAQLSGLWAAFIATYLISVGGDFRPHYRFFVPVLVWLMLTTSAGLHAMRAVDFRWLRSPFALAALALAFAWPLGGFFDPGVHWIRLRTERNPELFAVGDFMKKYAPPGSLIAISGGGIVPYRSDLPAIEMWGLTDLHIARTPSRRLVRGVPGHTKGDGAYILKRNPRYILFIALMSTTRAPDPDEIAARLAGPSELDLWQSKAFHERYALRTFPLPTGNVVSFFERISQ